ncbi:AraC family transcriptional regulator [Sulfurospirillum oryzae]|uniref:AraC family transcriptional regulator n=1 Tax=Sulfurospirillum oryzae TaxID=2976535 RepID=UPI0021E7888F|nr:AraC family transcriptional regulator [Sulfurospirillum oryzae]
MSLENTTIHQIKKVICFVEKHLNDDLDVATLSQIAGYSHFHFCRLFKLYTGESIGVFIRRLKLEKAAFAMVDKNKSITDIAIAAGYDTPSGFYKAFNEFFGYAPSEHKRQKHIALKKIKGATMLEPKIVTREAINTIRCRRIGAYNTSTKEAWGTLCTLLQEYAIKNNLPNMLSDDKQEAIGIGYDDPTITAPEKIRYEACLSFEKTYENLPEGLSQNLIEGGRFASLLHKGSYNNMYDSWMKLYSWVTEQGLELRENNLFEKYLNDPTYTSEALLETELFLPIR